MKNSLKGKFGIRLLVAILVAGFLFSCSLFVAGLTGWYIPDGSPRLTMAAVWMLFLSAILGLAAVCAYRGILGWRIASFWLLLALIIPFGQGVILTLKPAQTIECDREVDTRNPLELEEHCRLVEK
ncbi:hypothetical protein HS041_28095 [Planomonospora sp. ID67723]|uniref:hypothetical protein n=1 Tax=Planomonospora sp. ID67723 TaxID=2738134 RepID=UPI0018C3A8AB|nr:hypothetical protein [Planomonospora sp. ID67723]MBG0831598.1 hypothetical protein [Planomonospora sp. ID67723]